MAAADPFRIDPETTRQITKETMVRAACELLARVPFIDDIERIGALEQIADSVLPANVRLEFIRGEIDGQIKRSR